MGNAKNYWPILGDLTILANTKYWPIILTVKLFKSPLVCLSVYLLVGQSVIISRKQLVRKKEKNVFLVTSSNIYV